MGFFMKDICKISPKPDYEIPRIMKEEAAKVQSVEENTEAKADLKTEAQAPEMSTRSKDVASSKLDVQEPQAVETAFTCKTNWTVTNKEDCQKKCKDSNYLECEHHFTYPEATKLDDCNQNKKCEAYFMKKEAAQQTNIGSECKKFRKAVKDGEKEMKKIDYAMTFLKNVSDKSDENSDEFAQLIEIIIMEEIGVDDGVEDFQDLMTEINGDHDIRMALLKIVRDICSFIA